MKLYSRGQLVLVGIGGAAFALLLGVGIGLGAGLVHMPAPAVRNTAKSSGPVAAFTGTTAIQVKAPLSGTALSSAEISAEYSPEERENIDVYERLNEGVVNITTEQLYYNWFSDPVPQEGDSGSGSIIDAQGYVLTNKHVVKDAYKVYVGLADGSRFEAKVIGIDPENDLAVIKFAPPKGVKLTIIPYGDSTRLRVGQKLLAIGNPFGLERTLTRGIVSGIGRPVSQTERAQDGGSSTVVIQNMIQTDASINPGNSGGPLLNSRGELVGVNTMIYSPSGGSVGIGFAVPVATAKRVVPELMKDGRVARGWIDVMPVPLFSDLVDYMKQNGIPAPVESGLLISQAKKAGNADRAGIRGGTTQVRTRSSSFFVGGDIIVSINGVRTESMAQLYVALENTKPGDKVDVVYYRGNKKLTAQVQLSDRARAGIQN
ncbi:MAG: trypsin-like peptidase domain-containing protein [Rectinemataceae bacterium]|jgi:S1-C subfamily serine protease